MSPSNICVRCHRALRDPLSVARGIGPICLAREGGAPVDTDDAAELLPGDPLVMVVCQRVLTGRLSHDGAPLTEARTNVPRRVVHHSPGGFEWGYSGSGPADLALNILDLYVPVTTDTRPPVACFRGSCSRFAWDHHQSFKQLFLASMSRDGGTISAHAIGLWVMALWPPAPEEVLIP